MAATDTIVGIVGAVLLAAVMVGVFVYEYNNAPATVNADSESKEHFGLDYPSLNATGDLDGDHVANYLDNDMDGDGIANDNDTATAVTQRFSGSLGMVGQTATTDFKVHIDPGNDGSVFTLTYNTTAPLPGAAPRVPTLEVSLLGPDGSSAGVTPQTTQSGSAVTSVMTVSGLDGGEYTVRVTATVSGPQAASFGVKAVLDYGAGHPGATMAH